MTEIGHYGATSCPEQALSLLYAARHFAQLGSRVTACMRQRSGFDLVRNELEALQLEVTSRSRVSNATGVVLQGLLQLTMTAKGGDTLRCD